MTRCDCCDLPVESCGRAAEQRQRQAAQAERRRLLAAGHWPAQYAGTCAGCGTPFREGDPITRRGEGFSAGCCA